MHENYDTESSPKSIASQPAVNVQGPAENNEANVWRHKKVISQFPELTFPEAAIMPIKGYLVNGKFVNGKEGGGGRERESKEGRNMEEGKEHLRYKRL